MAAAMISKKCECAKTMAVLPGLVMSLYVAIGSAARIHTSKMYENLKEQLQPSNDPSDKCTWKLFIRVRDWYKCGAQWFIDNLDRVDGKPIVHLHPLMVLDLTFYCDASATGFSTFLCLPNDFLFECANKFLDNLIAASKEKMSKTQVYQLSKHSINVYRELTEAQCEKSSTWSEL
eukprot:1311675-Rhodomonas_salina.1